MRYRVLFLQVFLLLISNAIDASVIKGRINDSVTGEELIGATVFIKELNAGTISGLDGSYIIKNVNAGSYTLICSFIGYQGAEIKITLNGNETKTVDISLVQQLKQLSQVTISAQRDKSTDYSARSSERTSIQVINVVSAKTLELSPDLNVANAMQRMSGITLDKSSSGSGQYALLRGMDKRYNYTLINGIKIPSTHNKHRYIYLDMFPSDMVDRIEVTKALTPNMEGDAIGGAVNLVMKNAPEKMLIQANLSAGYSQFLIENNALTFDTRDLNPESPYERNGSGYRAVTSDFPTDNLIIRNTSIPVNSYGNLTLGNRFLNKKLGWILSGSYQNTFSGQSNLYFSADLSRDGLNLPVLSSMSERIYSEKKTNYGIHNKFDY